MATIAPPAMWATAVRRAPVAEILAAIGDPAVSLALWERPALPGISIGKAFVDLAFEAPVAQLPGALAQRLRLGDRFSTDAIARDVAALASRYATLLDLDRVAVRLERVAGRGCWRFHADYVTVRLLSTYVGKGTQWLNPGASDADHPEQMASGDVGLFKGRLFAGPDAIIHRSPPIAAGDEERLLLAIDSSAAELDRARARYEAQCRAG